MIDTRNTEQLVAATGAVLSGALRTSGRSDRGPRHQRHDEIFSIFGMYRQTGPQATGA